MRRLLLPALLVGLLSGCVGTGGFPAGRESPSPQPVRGLSASDHTTGLGYLAPFWPQSGGMVLGQTIDEAANPHTLVLNVAPEAQQTLVSGGELFAVLSGGTSFSVTGDAAVGAWRFTVDAGATGAAAPIVVLKFAGGTVEDLARLPGRFAAAASLNEDAAAASVRLQALIATVLATAQLPDGQPYAQLARNLQDPGWNGVLVFGASAAVPGEVLGQPTGALAGTTIASVATGFTQGTAAGASADSGTFFGAIDHTAAPPLRAVFANGALTSFALD